MAHDEPRGGGLMTSVNMELTVHISIQGLFNPMGLHILKSALTIHKEP